MMPPRRTDTAADPTLVTGLLGVAALLGVLRAMLGELADDGDRGPPGVEPARDGVFDEVVDVVLGLAALTRAASRHLPDDRSTVAGDRAAPPAPGPPAVTRELLR